MLIVSHSGFYNRHCTTVSSLASRTLLRYILEYASNVREACELVKDIPIHGAYNVTLLDRNADVATLTITAGETTRINDADVATNHQPGSSWPKYEEKVHTFLRHEYLSDVISKHEDSADSFAQRFLQPPLYNSQFARGFGTLYTAAYFPTRGECQYWWPGKAWSVDFQNFQAPEYSLQFIDPEGFSAQAGAYAEVYTSNKLPGLSF